MALALGACSIMDGEKIDYKSAAKGNSLEVPPDLTQINADSRFIVPGATVTASGYQGAKTTVSTAGTASNSMGDIRVERQGNTQYLVVDRPADKLWGSIRDFWLDNGFLLTVDQQEVGVMETDWAENRAKIPQDFIRNTIGKVIDSVYSTSERDRFRTRLERGPNGTTEIYVTHRGVEEVFSNRAQDSTVWQPRKADPGLEAEFLRRMMVALGTSQERSKVLIAQGIDIKPTSRVSTVNNVPVVLVDDDFDRAWRRVGLSLDRTGFTVEDRDRSKGTYFVRYVQPNPDKKEPGFFAKFFTSNNAVPPLKYRITVRSEGTSSTVSVLNADGAPESSDNAKRIVQVIADDMR